jgi:DNA-binding IclR family transcriptional regulator
MSSLDNALRLLALLRDERPGLRVTDAAIALELPKSSVSRMVSVLVQAGMIERDGERQGFRAGPELFRLGSLYRARIPAEERIDEALRYMVARFPATAYVGVLRGMDLVVLRRHEGFHPVRFIQEPGSVIPAYGTAVGRALLARLPDETLRSALPPFLSLPSRTVDMSRAALLKQLGTARRRGFATYDDAKLGIGAIGVALRVTPTRELGFALCFAREQDRAAQAAMSAALHDTACAIGRLCGDAAWLAARGAASGRRGT